MMQIRMGNAIKPRIINRTDEFQSPKRADYHSDKTHYDNNLNGSTDRSLLEDTQSPLGYPREDHRQFNNTQPVISEEIAKILSEQIEKIL